MKTDLNWGLITGIGVAAWILVEYILGFHSENMEIGKFTGYFAVIIPLLTYYYGIREKRDQYLDGTITFGRAFGSGILISLITSVILTIFMFIYVEYINPEWFESGVAYEMQKLEAAGYSGQEIGMKLTDFAYLYSTPTQLIVTFFGTLIQGFLISIAMAFTLKKK